MEDKSLKDYLINIENNTGKKHISLKEVCGEPFQDYIKDSEYFVIEPFERKIKDFKKVNFAKILVMFILSVVSLVGSFFLKQPFSFVGIALSFVLIAIFILDFVIISTQKTKMNIKKWNSLAKFEFYFSDQGTELINHRPGNGTMISLVFSILGLLALIGMVIISLINGFDQLIGPVMCLSSCAILYVVLILSFRFKYYYPVVMVDKTDSYLTWAFNDIKKVEKK